MNADDLDALLAGGYAAWEDGYYYLTLAGEAELDRLYGESLSPAERVAAEELLDAFSVLDGELKRLAQAWQLKPDGSTNQHDDAAYDQEVLKQLSRLDDETQELLGRQRGAVRTLVEGFARRLAAASTAIQAGDYSRFTSADGDSYHTVWLELHEELLRAAGRVREE